MPRPIRAQPYNPALAEYQRQQKEAVEAKRKDRRSTDLLRNAQVAPMEIDCPIDGSTLIVMRSTRDDPLGRLHAHRQIDEAQYQGGRAYQDDFETAERGPRAIDPTREAVDGGRMPEPITEGQRKAVLRLNRIHRVLGQDGAALIHQVLIKGQTCREVGVSRALHGRKWEEYFGIRFRQCLGELAIEYDFSMRPR